MLNGAVETYLVFYGFEKVVDGGISWNGKLHNVQPNVHDLLHRTGRPGHRHKRTSIRHRVPKVHIWIIRLLLKQREIRVSPTLTGMKSWYIRKTPCQWMSCYGESENVIAYVALQSSDRVY